MHPPQFDYVRVTTVQEALAALQQDDAKILAGGHSLLPAMKLRLAEPATLVDIGRIAELGGIERANDHLRIGALATHDEVASSPDVQQVAQMVAEAAGKIGDPAVRNWGTIGGSLAHADPASDLPAAVVAAGATLTLTGTAGARSVAAADFFVDLFLTQLAADELLTEVRLPLPAAGTGAAYLKQAHPASGYAVAGAAAQVTLDADRRCVAARLVVGGAAAIPVVADTAALAGAELTAAAIDKALATGLSVEEPMSDSYADGPYRLRIARVLGRRALLLAAERAAASA